MNDNPYSLTKHAGFWDVMDTASLGASFIPVIGGAINGIYNTGRAIGHAAQGDWGKAGEKMLYAGLGLIPGGAVAGKGAVGVVKGLSTAARMAGSANKAVSAAGKGLQAVGRAGRAVAASPVGQQVAQAHKAVVNTGFGQQAQRLNTALGNTKAMQKFNQTSGIIRHGAPMVGYQAAGALGANGVAPAQSLVEEAMSAPRPTPKPLPPVRYRSLEDMMTGIMNSQAS